MYKLGFENPEIVSRFNVFVGRPSSLAASKRASEKNVEYETFRILG